MDEGVCPETWGEADDDVWPDDPMPPLAVPEVVGFAVEEKMGGVTEAMGVTGVSGGENEVRGLNETGIEGCAGEQKGLHCGEGRG